MHNLATPPERFEKKRDAYSTSTVVALEVASETASDHELVTCDTGETYGAYRWLKLVVFLVSNVLSGMAYWSYDWNPWSVSLSVLVVIPCWLVVDRVPVYQSYLLAMVGITISCWVRYSSESIAFRTVSLVIFCLFSGLFIVLPARFSSEYFPNKERLFTTSLVMFARHGGHSVGVVVDKWFVDKKTHWLKLSIACSVTFVLSLCFLDALRSARCKYTQSQGILAQMKRLVGNWAYIRLLLCTSMVYAVNSAYILSLWAYAPSSIASAGGRGSIVGILLFAGLMGSLVFPVICYQSLNGKLVLVARVLIVLFSVIFFPFLVGGWVCNLAEVTYIAVTGCGFFGFVLLPLSIEMGVELTYQSGVHSEGAITGLAFVVGNLICYGLFSLNRVGPEFSAKVVPFISLGVMLTSTYLYFTIPQRYLRGTK
mmetsp:Transcript_18187/g.29552  ORF Transcript_18187/g.29552 Transcript_18187/m.29552 type:complete len:426 (+) Transcript_18187:617-1894(+)